MKKYYKKENKQINQKIFKKHFYIYFKNDHPAFIVDEKGNMYLFHRLTHSKKSGRRNNIKVNNPLIKRWEHATYIVKREENDSKGCFSLFELELRPGVDIEDLLKKAGGSLANAVNNVSTSMNNGLAHKRHKSSGNIKSKMGGKKQVTCLA